MLVNGIAVEVEKPRKGTKCAFCGEPIDDYGFIKTSTNHQTSAFVHTECLRMRRYHETFYAPSGNKLPLFDNSRKATTREKIISYKVYVCLYCQYTKILRYGTIIVGNPEP